MDEIRCQPEVTLSITSAHWLIRASSLSSSGRTEAKWESRSVAQYCSLSAGPDAELSAYLHQTANGYALWPPKLSLRKHRRDQGDEVINPSTRSRHPVRMVSTIR